MNQPDTLTLESGGKPAPTLRCHVSLALCTLLHGFTHAYGSMLVPLYTSMKSDLGLSHLWKASIVVTVYGMVYMMGSYAGGVLADRYNRKMLLGVGLLGNAAAIGAMGLTHNYAVILLLAVLAGLFGTIFHPAANAVCAAYYPRNPGMAIGILGIGSGLGFFVGPQFSGWRTQAAAWHWGGISDWQKPCVELGLAGLIVGVIFLMVAHDPAPTGVRRKPVIFARPLRNRIMKLASVLMFRDFAGVAMLSLAALYTQKAFGKSVQESGLIVGLMMLPSMIFSPLAVYFSPGKRRLPALRMILILGGIAVVFTPFWPARCLLLALCLFQTLQLVSYAISDAAMLERIAPDVRGRVVGIFLVIAGTFGALGPWVMGAWVDFLGKNASNPLAYIGPCLLPAVCMCVASLSIRMIAKLGPPLIGSEIGVMEEISPRTMEGVM